MRAEDPGSQAVDHEHDRFRLGIIRENQYSKMGCVYGMKLYGGAVWGSLSAQD